MYFISKYDNCVSSIVQLLHIMQYKLLCFKLKVVRMVQDYKIIILSHKKLMLIFACKLLIKINYILFPHPSTIHPNFACKPI